MLNATHGPWCGAVTWKTKCPRPGCRADVYFFRCNCGSKVFFDSLGAPWPIHDCDLSWGQGLDRQRNESGGATVQIAPGVTAYRSGSISPDVVTRTKRRDSTPDPIVSVRPDCAGSTKIMGIVRELRTTVDVMQSLKLPPSSFTAALLGPLGKGQWGKVTIHVPGHDDVLRSYTAWARRAALTLVKHSAGITVAATLQIQSVPGNGAVWVCKHYEVLMG